MYPLLSRDRADSAGGLWSSKFGGQFEEFTPNPSNTDGSTKEFYITGKADIRELGGYLRVFHSDIKIVKRPIVITDDYKAGLLAKYRDSKQVGDEENIDTDSDDDEETKIQKKETKASILENLIEVENNRPVQMKPLGVYLTTKKPKVRMVDVQTTATKLLICKPNSSAPVGEGVFGKEYKVLDYQSPLRDIAVSALFNYQGMVALTVPTDSKLNDEPVIYGMLKLQSAKNMLRKTNDALQLTELTETLSKIFAKIAADVETSTSSSAVISQPTDHVKSLKFYAEQADKTWLAFAKAPDEAVPFEVFFKMLDSVNLFMIQSQALRLFRAVDLEQDGRLGISEFETFLIAYDSLDMESQNANLVVLDVFDALKSTPLDFLVEQEFLDDTGGKVEEESSGSDEEAKRRKKKENRRVQKKRSKAQQKLDSTQGIDYSTFSEAVQLLGVPPEVQSDPIALREAFCVGGDVQEKDAADKYLSVHELRKGWLHLADVNHECKKRGMRTDLAAGFGKARMRDRITRVMTDAEDAYLTRLGNITVWVEDLKKERRIKKDEKKRKQEAHRDQLMHEANKFFAIRAQEKRLLLKKEQEEKSKKRLEDKILRNKLLHRQQENTANKRMEIGEMNKKNERERLKEIAEKGLDKLDMSNSRLKEIPGDIYKKAVDSSKLTFLLLANFSVNLIEKLPDGFLYWMSEARQLVLSHNKLKKIPDEIEKMSCLKILELSNNRLESPLSDGIGYLTSLQRLDLSNNNLTSLPDKFSALVALKFISAHSNYIQQLPLSLGSCCMLEFVDFSRNQIEEVPESFEHLVTLTHLDLFSNKLQHLPQNLGKCEKLQYLDISVNILNSLPSSFSQMKSLEYCNMENNNLRMLAQNATFNGLVNLKYFNIRQNHINAIHPDIEFSNQLIQFDGSCNNIASIPPEIGLLTHLQELKLHRNQITSIPAGLGACSNLQTLEIPYNNIEGTLPDQIGRLRTLVHLDISFNKITALPESVIAMKQLKSIFAEQCCLSDFPDNFLHLDKLEVLRVRNNRFTVFPIQLHKLKSLKELDLANNALTLLPRNINVMTSLEVLDLSRNQLECLPHEFTDVLESVPRVELHTNPWSALPSKWGKLWPGMHCTEGSSSGYNISDVVDFLYAVGTFYDCAEQMWEETGAFHCMGRLGFEDYLQELRRRLPRSWHEGLVEYVKHFYFIARQSAVFPVWYETSDFVKEEVRARKEFSDRVREANVAKSRVDQAAQLERAEKVYGPNSVSLSQTQWKNKIRHFNDMSLTQNKNLEILERLEMNELVTQAKTDVVKIQTRIDRRERNFDKLRHAETNRLTKILDTDKEGIAAYRKKDKERNSRINIKLESLRNV